QIDWARLGINFVMVFSPGTLEAAPQTHLAAVYVAPGEAEEALVRQVTERFPNVSAIPVREGLAAVARVVATIGSAIRLVALLTLAAGLLVLGGAVAAGHRRPSPLHQGASTRVVVPAKAGIHPSSARAAV